MSDKLNIKIKALGILDLLEFKKLVPNRQKRFEEASITPIIKVPHNNALANELHPKKQVHTITKVEEATSDMKTYTLKSDKPAYFRAGQYLSVKLNIDGHIVSRPYSISSSPEQTKNGEYTLTIKSSPEGFVSNYILDNWKEGDSVVTSAPEGNFYYEDLRDPKTIIALAGGAGITPFYSMAKSIYEGIEDFNLTIIYGVRTEKDIAYKVDFDKFIKETDGKVKVIYVLSDVITKKKGYEIGFITKEIIKKYIPTNSDYSIFICGPQVMYNFVDKEIASFNLPIKNIRREMFGQINDIEANIKFPKAKKGKKYNLIINMGGVQYKTVALSNESVLVAIERVKGLVAPSRCRAGECGWCRSRLISGDVFIPEDNDGRRAADKKFGFIHPCASFPISDLEIEVPTAK